MRIINKCFICGSNKFSVLKTYRFKFPRNPSYDKSLNIWEYSSERLWLFFEKIWPDKKYADFEIVLCQICGLIFTNPRFTPEEIKVKYRAISELETDEIRFRKKPPLKVVGRANRIYNLLQQIQIPEKKSLKVLDYGGGRGHNLIPFLKSGHQGYIIDYIKYNHNQNIEYLGQDMDCLGASDKFDVILLCHTLEHATFPKQLLKQLISHMTDSSLFYVEVPFGSWQEWKYLQEPLSHVNFFSEESLFKCFYLSGLNPIHLSTDYQWFMYEKIWCLNIIGKKMRQDDVVKLNSIKFKGTLQQINNRFYHFETLFDDLKNILTKPLHSTRFDLTTIKENLLKFIQQSY